MTMNREVHPRNDVAWLYVFRKNAGRGPTRCENDVKSGESGVSWYLKNNIELLLVPVRTSRTIITVDPTLKNTRKLKNSKEKIMDCKKNAWTIC